MNIAICDDDLAQTNYLSSLVRSWADNANTPVTIEQFASAEAFQFAWSGDGRFDCLLLDVQMPGQNGLDLAKAIRRKDDRLVIIFISGYTEYLPEGYEVSALHYLIKPIKDDKLFECLDKACKRLQAETPVLLVDCGGESVRIRQDEILYLEAFAHTVMINTTDRRYEVRVSLGGLAKSMDSALFFQPHRSYYVGLKYVRQIGKAELILDNGTKIPVSRRLYNEVNRQFINFYRSES